MAIFIVCFHHRLTDNHDYTHFFNLLKKYSGEEIIPGCCWALECYEALVDRKLITDPELIGKFLYSQLKPLIAQIVDTLVVFPLTHSGSGLLPDSSYKWFVERVPLLNPLEMLLQEQQ